MASMVFASSPLSAQSFVKLRTNSNYSHPSCYVPRGKNSFVPLSHKNIESSKSLFTKGDGNFYFSSPKFPRVASTYSPSLNIIKAQSIKENIYHYTAHDLKKGKYIQLNDDYQGMVLLIVNIPHQGSKWAKEQIEFLNDLRELYEGKTSSFGRGFEVLGFFHDMEELADEKEKKEISKLAPGEEEIRKLAKFPLFGKVKVNNDHESFWRKTFIPSLIEDEITNDLWYFLRKSQNIKKIEQEFEKFLVDGTGKPVQHFVRFDGETVKPMTVKPGEYPGDNVGSESRIIDPTNLVKDAIDAFGWT